MTTASTATGSTDTGAYPTPAASVAQLFYDRVAATPSAEAFRYPAGTGWTSVSWARTADTVKTLAAGLLSLGIQPEQRVAIASNTRIEWLYADLAIMCAGAATTAVYPSTTADDVLFILADSETRVVFAEDDAQIEKLRRNREHLPHLVQVVTFDGTSDGEWVLSLADLEARGARHLVEHPTCVDEAVAAVQPEDLATLIYTSGTTGRPKGVELPHRCWTYLGAGAQGIGILRSDDLQYLWLPLSHSFGKMLAAVQLQIGFPSAVDGRIDKIVDNLAVVQPTFMAGPPRIFEKVHAKIVADRPRGRRHQGPAVLLGVRGQRAGRAGPPRPAGPPGRLLRWQYTLADRLVLAKIRARLGGRMRFMVSGSAALSQDIAAWFGTAGMTLIEGYGLTETGGGACIGDPDDPGLGVVGPPLIGSELRIADDGEILLRGPLRDARLPPPAGRDGARSSAPTAGSPPGTSAPSTSSGRLRVTDRKKDLIKTSGGKFIAPQPIEAQFKAVCPLASQMLVHAERRNYATALIALDPEALAQWGRAQDLAATDYHLLAADPAVRGLRPRCVEQLNAQLNRWETIKDFRILDHDLSVADDELTPSLKIKRRVIEARFADLLDSMYDAT